jgi:acyl-CoA thioesterase
VLAGHEEALVSTDSDLLIFMARDRFSALVGIELVDAAPGQAKARLVLQEHHLNGADIVQGGVLFTLADFAFAAASNSHGQMALAINANISFFRPAQGKVLTAKAQEVSLGNRLATYTVDVDDEDGTRLAQFTGTVYRKKDKVR